LTVLGQALPFVTTRHVVDFLAVKPAADPQKAGLRSGLFGGHTDGGMKSDANSGTEIEICDCSNYLQSANDE